MASEWFQIPNLGKIGVEPDKVISARDDASLDIAINVRAYGNELRNAGGYALASALPDRFHTMWNGGKNVSPSVPTPVKVLIFGGNSSIYMYDGLWKDITPTAGFDNSEPDRRLTGGWLVNCLTIASDRQVCTFRPSFDAVAQDMVLNSETGQTWRQAGWNAQVFRPFKNFMLAGHTYEVDTAYRTRLRWSDPVEEGGVPNNWIVEGAGGPVGSLAGSVSLGDTAGSIMDMVPLRDILMIYKSDSIYQCRYIGGQFIFDISQFTNEVGIATTEVVAARRNKHYFQGIEDIYVTDGNSIQSILYGKFKNYYLSDRDFTKHRYNWTYYDRKNEEIVFAYPSINQTETHLFPTKAVVLSLRNNSLFLVDWDNIQMTMEMYSTDGFDQFYGGRKNYCIDFLGDKLLAMDESPTRDGIPVIATIEREGLFGIPGTSWIQVDAARINFQGTPQTCDFRLGERIAIDAPTNWRQLFNFDPATQYKIDARANGNLISYGIYLQTSENWKMNGIELLVQKSGERG